MRKKKPAKAILGVGVVVVLGAGPVLSHATGRENKTAVMVEEDIEYQPDVLTVHTGQSIRVENKDPFEHKTRVTLQKSDGSLGTMAVTGHVDKPGKSFTFTLDEAGTYEVRCLLHDGMVAVIKVVK